MLWGRVESGLDFPIERGQIYPRDPDLCSPEIEATSALKLQVQYAVPAIGP